MTSSTLDNNRKTILKNALFHLLFSVFCAFFGAVYESFSFGVYSNFMIYAFGIPLLLGILPMMAIAMWESRVPVSSALRAWNSGIAVLTVGCIVQGVLNIYGTTNRLMIVYPIAGFVLLSAGIILFLSKNKCNISN